MISDLIGIVNIGLSVGETYLVQKNTEKLLRQSMALTLGMSALAVGFSIYQTYSIKNEIKKSEGNVKDIILRNQ